MHIEDSDKSQTRPPHGATNVPGIHAEHVASGRHHHDLYQEPVHPDAMEARSADNANRKRRWIRRVPDRTALRLYPELLVLEQPEARADVLRKCHRRLLWKKTPVLLVAAWGLLYWPFVKTLLTLITGLSPIHRYVAAGAAGGIYGLGLYYAGLWLFHRPRQRMIRQILVEKGFAICMECGYDLRGQTEPRCPECGTPFDPHLLDQAKAARQIPDNEPRHDQPET